jgi:hypothetical protein
VKAQSVPRGVIPFWSGIFNARRYGVFQVERASTFARYPNFTPKGESRAADTISLLLKPCGMAQCLFFTGRFSEHFILDISFRNGFQLDRSIRSSRGGRRHHLRDQKPLDLPDKAFLTRLSSTRRLRVEK